VLRRAFILAGGCLALTLSGCSLGATSASTSGFTGQAALVAATLNTLASDSSSANGADICKNVLAAPVLAKINKLGSCATIIDNQLKTVDDFTLKITTIKVKNSTATARVQTVHLGKKVIQTVALTHEPAGWRISSVSVV
jgi:hypothetical protein